MNMNAKNFVFGVLITFALVFPSLSAVEYNHAINQSTSPGRVTFGETTTAPTTFPPTIGQSQSPQLQASQSVQVIYLTDTFLTTERVSTIVSTKTVYNPNAAFTWYITPSVSLPVSWPGVLPPETVVGTGSQQDYAFDLIVVQTPCVCPPNSTCTCTMSYQQVDFSVHQWPTPLESPQWANFTWKGWASLPSPSNVTLFGGSVTMQWSVNSYWLSVDITVK